MRGACAHKLQLGMQRSAGTGKKYDGGKTWTEATRFREYNFTIKENDCRRKSIIVIGLMSHQFKVFPLDPPVASRERLNGGRRGDRTPDPRIANAVLSQLS